MIWLSEEAQLLLLLVTVLAQTLFPLVGSDLMALFLFSAGHNKFLC